jgi:serine/threonine-protein kinase
MITTTGRLVLLDFGLARDLGGTTLTQQNQIMGTLPYMAPEQLQGETCDAAADVWAWGIVVYEMLTGGLPWKARDTVRLAVEILSGAANVHAAIRDRVGEPFARLLDDVFELDPGKRIPDAARLLGRLASVEGLPELPIPARTEEMPYEPEVPATRVETTSVDGGNRDE